MDEYKCHELCRKAAGHATYARLRSRDILHHVQPVGTFESCLLKGPE